MLPQSPTESVPVDRLHGNALENDFIVGNLSILQEEALWLSAELNKKLRHSTVLLPLLVQQLRLEE